MTRRGRESLVSDYIDNLINSKNRSVPVIYSRSGTHYGREQSLTVFCGLSRQATVSCFNNSLHNLLNAVYSRVYCRKVGKVWGLISDTNHKSEKYIESDMGFLETFSNSINLSIAPMTDDNFIQHYSGHRRSRYEKARESLKHLDVSKSDANCKCFLKIEKDIQSDKPDSIPRVITFPDPRFGMEFGKFIKPIEHDFFSAIDCCFGESVVMKSKNYKQVGEIISEKWEKYNRPFSIDCDVSRLDSSISDEAQRLYHKYASLFYYEQDIDYFKQLCDWQLNVDVSGKAYGGNVRYKSQGLGSGQMNTSQMGVFVVCYILHYLFQKHALTLSLVNCGDDFTVIGEEEDVRNFERIAVEEFNGFNMTLKIGEINDEIEGIEFCQTRPIKTKGGYRMCRNPDNAIVKDSSSINPLERQSEIGSFLRAISLGGLASHGDMPIFKNYYEYLGRCALECRSKITSKRGIKTFKKKRNLDNSMFYWGKNLDYTDSVVTIESRISFMRAFNIDPFQQIRMERAFDNGSVSLPYAEDDNLEYVFTDFWESSCRD